MFRDGTYFEGHCWKYKVKLETTMVVQALQTRTWFSCLFSRSHENSYNLFWSSKNRNLEEYAVFNNVHDVLCRCFYHPVVIFICINKNFLQITHKTRVAL